jgi:hypothetical protein
MTLLCLAFSDLCGHVTFYFLYVRYMVEVLKMSNTVWEGVQFTGFIYRISVFCNGH